MMNTRCTKLSMVRDDSQSSKTSNKKCPVDLHGDHIIYKQIYSKDCGVKVTRRVFYMPHGVVGASPTDLRYCLHP